MLHNLELYGDVFVSASRAVTLQGDLLAFRVWEAFNRRKTPLSGNPSDS